MLLFEKMCPIDKQMRIRKLSQAEFAHSVQRGFGAAFLHVRHHGDSDVRQLLLDACLKNYVYDWQIDGSRSGWLVTLIDASGNTEYYANEILNALKSDQCSEDCSDYVQLIELAARLFDRGFTDFGTLLLTRSTAAVAEERIRWAMARALVDVAGFEGLFKGATLLRTDGDSSELYRLLEYACFAWDEDLELYVRDDLADRAKHDITAAALLKAVESEKSTGTSKSSSRRSKMTVDEYIAFVRDSGNDGGKIGYRGPARRFAHSATEDDIRKLIEQMKRESDPERIAAYVAVLAAKPVQDGVDHLIHLLTVKHEKLQRETKNALSKLRSEKIRLIALEQLAIGSEENVCDALMFLELNCIESDLDAIHAALPSVQSFDGLHGAARSLESIAETIGKNAGNLLLWAYRNNPCSHCRGMVLRTLVEWDCADPELVFEAQFDCDTDVRQFARSAMISLGAGVIT